MPNADILVAAEIGPNYSDRLVGGGEQRSRHGEAERRVRFVISLVVTYPTRAAEDYRLCPLLAQSGHPNALNRCLLLGVNRRHDANVRMKKLSRSTFGAGTTSPARAFEIARRR